MSFKSFMILLLSTFMVCHQEVKAQLESCPTLAVGNLEWSSANLSVKHFSNGESIKQAKNQIEWLKLNVQKKPAWCYLNFDPDTEKEYGLLYNAYAILDDRELAPTGWHIPSYDEWFELEQFLDGLGIAWRQLQRKKHLESAVNSDELELSQLNQAMIPEKLLRDWIELPELKSKTDLWGTKFYSCQNPRCSGKHEQKYYTEWAVFNSTEDWDNYDPLEGMKRKRVLESRTLLGYAASEAYGKNAAYFVKCVKDDVNKNSEQVKPLADFLNCITSSSFGGDCFSYNSLLGPFRCLNNQYADKYYISDELIRQYFTSFGLEYNKIVTLEILESEGPFYSNKNLSIYRCMIRRRVVDKVSNCDIQYEQDTSSHFDVAISNDNRIIGFSPTIDSKRINQAFINAKEDESNLLFVNPNGSNELIKGAEQFYPELEGIYKYEDNGERVVLIILNNGIYSYEASVRQAYDPSGRPIWQKILWGSGVVKGNKLYDGGYVQIGFIDNNLNAYLPNNIVLKKIK